MTEEEFDAFLDEVVGESEGECSCGNEGKGYTYVVGDHECCDVIHKCEKCYLEMWEYYEGET